MKIRNFPFLVIMLCLLSLTMYSQNEKVDSMKNHLSEQSDDSLKVENLLAISKSTFRYEPDTAIVYGNKAINLATQINYQKGLGYGLKNVGLAYYIKGDFTEVLNYWKKSLAIFEKMDFKLGISNLQNNLGAVYFSKGEDPKALEYYLSSLKLAEEINDSSRIATAYVNIGAVYVNSSETYDKAIEAYNKSLKISEELKYDDGVGTNYMNIGELYLKKRQPNLALENLSKSLEAFKRTGGAMGTTLNFIGNAYDSLGNYNKSIQFNKDAFANAQEKESKPEMTKALNSMGNAYIKQGAHNQAIESFYQALELASATGIYLDKKDSYEGLSIAHSNLNNYKEAYRAQRNFINVKDTIRSEEYDENIGNLRFKFDLDNKQKEIALLNSDNDLKAAEIERSSLFRKFLYALAGLLLVVIGGVTYQYRYAMDANKKLDKAKQQAESILLNILPKATADELKSKGSVEPRMFEDVTVLFTDFKDFSKIAETISAEYLVQSLDYYFKEFDRIALKYGLEKIKTIGDAYMCAGGLPGANKSHPEDAFLAAQEILHFVRKNLKNPPDGIQTYDIRIGLNTGPAVAGVVGTSKFQYDIWGRAVNVAARMESSSEAGKLNVSDPTYNRLKDSYTFDYRGELSVKNVGMLKMYFAQNVDESRFRKS